MNEREPPDFTKLPQWPAEAKDLPEGPQRKHRARWAGLGAGLGVGTMLVFFGILGGGHAGAVAGQVVALGLAGFLIGYGADRREERLDRIYHR
jgi:hypothetical protein